MELVKLIAEKKGISEDEVWRLIEEKRKELDYLISEEGASHILASEYGVEASPEFKVASLSSGASGIEIFLKVLGVFPMREFERNGKKGKVRNLRANDETGEVGVSLWDDKAEVEIKTGDVLKISGAYVRKVGTGIELRAGKRATLEVNPGEAPDSLKKRKMKERSLKSLEVGERVDIEAELESVARREPFFSDDEGRQLMISGTISDGKTSMRAVFFRNAAEMLIRMKRKRALKLADEEGFESLLKRVPIMRALKIRGRVKHSDYTDSNELIVDAVRRVDPGEKVDGLIEKMMGL